MRCWVRAKITRWIDKEPQPGIVECRFEDANGRTHSFVGKYVYFTKESLWEDSVYPQAGFVACEIVARWTKDNIELAEIDTDSNSLGEISVDGESRFIVHVDQLEHA